MHWIHMAASALRGVEYFLIFYVGACNLFYMLLMALGYFCLQGRSWHLPRAEQQAILTSPLVPAISVIAPAYNEAMSIRESVRAQLALHYPKHEVIVVNDGSRDNTLELLVNEFRLYRSARMPSGTLPSQPVRAVYESCDPIRLVVVDKENGGKADSLNAGINFARSPLVAAVDSDSLMEKDALLHIVRPFLEDPEGTLATGGIVRVVNDCRVEHGEVTNVVAPRSFIARIQALEYLRAFLGGRVAFSLLDSMLLISGAFGMFRRDALLAAGGFDTNTVGEDMEIVVRIQRIWRGRGLKARVLFVPEPVCWTEVPETWKDLHRQCNRWQRGTVETLRKHRGMFFRPRLGMPAMFALPYFAVFELFGPAFELAGYLCTIVGLATGILDTKIALLFLFASIALGLLLSATALVMEEFTARRYSAPGDLGRFMLTAVLENFGYRQLMCVWRAQGLIDGLRGKKGWGKMHRRGFQPTPR